MMLPEFWETELGALLSKYWYLFAGQGQGQTNQNQQTGQNTGISQAQLQALLNRLAALLRAARIKAEWESRQESAKTVNRGFVTRSKPGHVVQTVQATMGQNQAGGARRFVLGTGGSSSGTVEVNPHPVAPVPRTN
ncbi:MAG TPA: hypothetical protein HPP95_13110 [Deltaproteobacteria bacterium]|nr:hypothetical protein [Deltaproteobacteria bacterium]